MKRQINEGAIRSQTDILLCNILDVLLDIKILLEERESIKAAPQKPASIPRGTVKNYLPSKITENKGKGGVKK